MATLALALASRFAAEPWPRRAYRPLHTLFRGVAGSRFGRRRWGRCRQQLIGIVRLLLAGRRRCGANRLVRSGIRGLRIAPLEVAVAVPVAVALGDVAADWVLPALAFAVRTALLMAAMLMAAVLMTALPVAALVLAAMPLAAMPLTTALTTVALATVSLTTVALAAGLVAGILAIAHAGIHSLRIRAARIVERGGQALAYVLDIDVGDGEFASAHARPLAVIHGAQHAVIMVRVLQVILCRDPVSSGAGIAGKL